MSAPIPMGKSIVQVSIISPNRVLGVPASAFLTPDIKGTTYDDTPCLSFLIQHTASSGKETNILFDLGIRKDWQNSPPQVVEAIQSMKIDITTEKDTEDILAEHNVDPSSIDAVVLSHWHFDHAGDLNRFTHSTEVVVGPGFKQHLLPGYPADPKSLIDGTGFQGRTVREVSFADGLKIAGLNAIDWFGDGSFYLLDTPGHAIGHLSALARTTESDDSEESTFVLLAGDVCHHVGELRPSSQLKLPHHHADYINVHPQKCVHAPFYSASEGGFNLDAEEMGRTVTQIQRLDAGPNVFTILAHDNWLLGVVDLFPAKANAWKEKNWADISRWRFLKDFYM